MDLSLQKQIKEQIFKFEATLANAQNDDSCFTLEYEAGRYRQQELAGIIRDTVRFFALTEQELKEYDATEQNRRAFARISDADKKAKGDYGELLLFIILEIFYNTPKFVTKARLRSTTKEQIKGFDCAHFSIENNNDVILWLGEAKFYSDFSNAVRDALESLKKHLTGVDYIKSQLKLLGGEIEINKSLEREKYELLKSYVDGGKSLDKVPINVPVLITYDSHCIGSFCGKGINIVDPAFKKALEKELNDKFKTIHTKSWPISKSIKIIFFMVPFESVAAIKDQIETMEKSMKF